MTVKQLQEYIEKVICEGRLEPEAPVLVYNFLCDDYDIAVDACAKNGKFIVEF